MQLLACKIPHRGTDTLQDKQTVGVTVYIWHLHSRIWSSEHCELENSSVFPYRLDHLYINGSHTHLPTCACSMAWTSTCVPIQTNLGKMRVRKKGLSYTAFCLHWKGSQDTLPPLWLFCTRVGVSICLPSCLKKQGYLCTGTSFLTAVEHICTNSQI